MEHFKSIDYLNLGNSKQKLVFHLLTELKIMDLLKEFQPILAGTIPIAIDTENSDLDIICFWTERQHFINSLNTLSAHQDFMLNEKIIRNEPTIICRFNYKGFAIEIFGQNRPVHEQAAYRHMVNEYLILKREGEVFRQKIIELKKQGIKTEPAFAMLLGLKGDPYEELLKPI